MTSPYESQLAQHCSVNPGSRQLNDLRRIMTEITHDQQEQYNEIRRKQDETALADQAEQQRRNLQNHVDEQNNLLQLPQATPSLSRRPSVTSRTSQHSLTSLSTLHSMSRGLDGVNIGSPTSPPPRRPKPRGRRKGPLAPGTKAKTAIKRKMKLACEQCSLRRVKCPCFDPLLEALEEGYRTSCHAAANRAVTNVEMKAKGMAPREAQMMEQLRGTGGAAVAQPTFGDIAHELGEQSTTVPVEPRYRHYQSLVQMMGIFESPSVPPPSAALLPSPFEPIDNHVSAPIVSEELPILPIGSEFKPYKNCWQCEFVLPGSGTDTGSTSNTCPWTGHLDWLRAHYEESHHSFEDLPVQFFGKCSVPDCGFLSPGYETPQSCIKCEMSGQRWVRWYYGRASTLSTTETRSVLLQADNWQGDFPIEPGRLEQPPSSQERGSSSFNLRHQLSLSCNESTQYDRDDALK